MFKYTGRPSTRSAELGFYITKLAEATGFSPRRLHELTYQAKIFEWEQEYVETQNKGHSYIPNPFKHILWDLRSRKEKKKEEVNSPPGDDFEEQLLIGYNSPSEGGSSTKQRVFNYQDEIQRRETVGSDNPLIKEIPLVIDIEDLR